MTVEPNACHCQRGGKASDHRKASTVQLGGLQIIGRASTVQIIRRASTNIAESSVDTVRRVYIKTANDHMVKPEQQEEAVIRR